MAFLMTDIEYWRKNNMFCDDDCKANIGRNEYGGIFKCLKRRNPCFGPWQYMCKHGHFCQLRTHPSQKRPPM